MKRAPINRTSHWTGPDFRVRMASELVCPCCRRRLCPSGIRRETDAISLICEHCHQDVLSVGLSITEPVL
ncbi:hypothetical protein G6321_00039235 [Bradyrhizobium barranii subsp. barranii]|uniref:Uncharacterized protein n=1 Tax=Bradyrhizobium barranii subsp. barranii TaxID=2823807 RepID=A0A7Z0QF64_9BRAD|nr:hypothetical protein [Bradyrhizobium barranii]UGX91736.1 hypothetical protein G6321_00039235 [Bradyrhizobium barranii subsp. barranii]